MKKIYTAGLMGVIMLMAAAPAQAQLELSVDVMSRYIWRGLDAGNSPSLQPDISFTSGNLTVGGWASYATNGNPGGTEIDFYIGYAIETSTGTFELSVTDYTFPEAPSGNFFSADAHVVELGVGYSGTEKFPISLFLGAFVANDDDNSLYAEIGYSIGSVDLSLGMTPGATAMYGTNKAGIIHSGIGTSREVKVSDTFSFELGGQLIFNPYAQDAFFLVGISF
jgi:uncharacterized protein (TIGR02001 family)